MTLCAGHGGVGKSAIEFYRAVCIASGRDFFGLATYRRRVGYLSCEDRTPILHWRLDRICRDLDMPMRELAGWLHILDLVGRPTILWERDGYRGGTLTPAYDELRRFIRKYRVDVLFVDGISDTYGGNENARGEVKAFVNSLLALIPLTGALVLIGHIGKPAASGTVNGEGYSGSTQWHNAARARWYLRPETVEGEDGDRTKTGDLILELQKANFGPVDRSMRFTWDDDAKLFLGRPIGQATASDRAHRDRTERDAVLRCIEACALADIVVPAATSGPRTTYHTLSLRPEFPESLKGGKAERARFWRCVEYLRQSKCITSAIDPKPNRHNALKLLPVLACVNASVAQ